MSRTFAYLRLLRAGTLFSPAADVIAGICLAGGDWGGVSLRLVFASVCLYAAGMVLNDHADRKQDAVGRPERPIPSGDVHPNNALYLGVALLVVCLALSPYRLYHGGMILLVLGYDYVWKSAALLGALTMGALRALNLASGALPGMDSALPDQMVWIPAVTYAVYIIAVTFLGILEDERHPPVKAVRGLVVLPPIIAFLTLLGTARPWPAAGVGFVLLLVHVAQNRHDEWDQAKIRKAMMWLLLGTMVYTGLLCLGSERSLEAAAVFAMIVPARWIARRISLT